MSKPTLIKFFLEFNEDEELCCFFCKGKRCEQTFTCSGGGETRIIGVHNDCADKHVEKQAPRAVGKLPSVS